MATELTGQTFRRTKYPWSEWTDGRQWQIVKGQDYTISTYSMQISLHGRAKAQGLIVQSRSITTEGNEGLVFQFSEREA